MRKTIDIRINSFPKTPHRLRATPNVDQPRNHVVVDLARLYFHYYMDGWGVSRPEINVANFEYLEHLASCDDFRFRAGGEGANPERKRTTTNQLGRAFCRHVLHDFLGIPYFADLVTVLDKSTHPGFEGLRITRVERGDTPDFLCARSVSSPMLAEAKGRLSSIGFNTQEFEGWRRQFSRVEIRRADGPLRSVKGYIVGTRFATEAKLNTRSCIYLEDPNTPGEPLGEEDGVERALGRAAILGHYSRICTRFGMNLLAASLREGFTVPEQIQMQTLAWRPQLPEVADRHFIGGVISAVDRWQELAVANGGPLLLETPVFMGLDLSVARNLRRAASGSWLAIDDIEPIPSDLVSSDLALLDDGSVMGPATMFAPLGSIILEAG